MAISKYRTRKGEVRFKAVIWKEGNALFSKTFKRKIDAQKWLGDRGSELTNRTIGRLEGEKSKLEYFFFEVYKPNKRVSEGTFRDYQAIFQNYVLPKFAKRSLLSITEFEWMNFISGLVSKGMTKQRANRVHAAISSVFQLAIKLRFVSHNPLRAVDWYREDLKQIDYWSEEEIQGFLEWTLRTENPRFVVYQTIYELGLRVSELVGLQRDCVNLREGFIEIRRKFCRVSNQVLATTKSGRRRILFLSPGLKLRLREILSGHSDVFVFLQPDGSPVTYDYLHENFRTDQRIAGVRKIGLHGLRHTFASHYVMRGESIFDLQKLLGHSEIVSTSRYAHLSPEHLKSKAGVVVFTPRNQKEVISLAEFRSSVSTISQP